MPSWTQPIIASTARSVGEACNGRASGRATTIDSNPAIITIGSMSTVACTLRKTVTLSANSTDTPIASRLPARRPASSESANMMTMPANAIAIAIPVRNGTRSPRNTFAASAARNGEMLIRTNVFATVVRVSDAMNRKNWPARKRAGEQPRPADGEHRARHAVAMHHRERDDDEQRHEQRSPEYDLPGVANRQQAHEQSAGRPANRGDQHVDQSARRRAECEDRLRGSEGRVVRQ